MYIYIYIYTSHAAGVSSMQLPVKLIPDSIRERVINDITAGSSKVGVGGWGNAPTQEVAWARPSR